MSLVRLTNVTKRFGEVAAVDGVSLDVKKDEFYSLLGPSGCGKTSTLRIIAGIEEPDEGLVELNGVDARNIPSHKRGIGMVFQHLALFPHMNVFENIAFGLRMRKLGKCEIENRVSKILEIVDMKGFEKRKTTQISGGQQQRVAIARALVIEPSVVLLDEPLGALDLKIRQHMQTELTKIRERTKSTFFYITHDQGEALAMSDRIAVMNKGKIEQVGDPMAIYEKPETPFVASFIGETNRIEGRYPSPGIFESEYLDCPIKATGSDNLLGKNVLLIVRPDWIKVQGDLKDVDNVMEGQIQSRVYHGSDIVATIKINDSVALKAQTPTADMKKVLNVGDRVKIGFKKESAILLKAGEASSK